MARGSLRKTLHPLCRPIQWPRTKTQLLLLLIITRILNHVTLPRYTRFSLSGGSGSTPIRPPSAYVGCCQSNKQQLQAPVITAHLSQSGLQGSVEWHIPQPLFTVSIQQPQCTCTVRLYLNFTTSSCLPHCYLATLFTSTPSRLCMLVYIIYTGTLTP